MASWTTAERNALPDSCFACIEAGGKKDSEGKTTPRSLRHCPIRDAQGKPDDPHVRDALARAGAAVRAGGDTADIAKAALPKIRAAARELGGRGCGEGAGATAACLRQPVG